MSAITKDALGDDEIIYYEDTKITGIGGDIHAFGYVYLTLCTPDTVLLRHKFFVFDKLPIKSNGLLGYDFLKNFESVIDLGIPKVTFKCFNNLSEIHIYNSPKKCDKYLTIPARSESIHNIKLDSDISEDCVVHPQDLGDNLFLAGLIVKPVMNIIPIQILNTGDRKSVV